MQTTRLTIANSIQHTDLLDVDSSGMSLQETKPNNKLSIANDSPRSAFENNCEGLFFKSNIRSFSASLFYA